MLLKSVLCPMVRSVLLYFYVMEGVHKDDYIATENDLAQRKFIPGAKVLSEWQQGQLNRASTDFPFTLTNLTAYGTEEGSNFWTSTIGVAVIAGGCGFIFLVFLFILMCCCCYWRSQKKKP